MLDQMTGPVLTDWHDHYAELFGRHTLRLKHRLHLSPLFSDEALAALLEKADRGDYHVNLMDNGVRREGEFGDLPGKDILEAVRRGEIWINLRAPGRANPAYDALLRDIYADFEARVPGLQTYKQNLTILISSPNVRVKYHADVPGQSLWQVRGKKKVYLYPNSAPFVTQQALEKLTVNELHETDMPYRPWYDDYAEIVDLEPGEMLHWPLNGPHRVDNHDCMNVSVTTEHWTDALRNIYAANYANAMLRKLGFRKLGHPPAGPGLWTKLAIAGAVKFTGIRKKEAKPYRIDFRVDPGAPRGAADIPAYELRK